MHTQSVSQKKEDPLSTRPVLLLALWLGVLVIISNISWGITGYTSYIPHSAQRALQENTISTHSLEKDTDKEDILGEMAFNVVSAEEKRKEQDKKQLEREVRDMVSGYPIEAMIPFIIEQDRSVAAFLVGIAKKESDWGKHVPTKNGQECYNYWGYKGVGSLGHGMGYGCFANPEEAIAVVGGRIHTLVVEKKNETPRDMVIWKCGSRSCIGHAPGSAEKWINDVNVYYSRLVAFAR